LVNNSQWQETEEGIMERGLLGDFQPQGVDYGNILMDEPVQYGLDDGFGALAEVMQMYADNAMRGVSAPYRAYTGELGDPMEEAMNVAGLVTGGGLLTGAPERMAAAEAGQSMLGMGGGLICVIGCPALTSL
jgi:hypothetical protein